MEYHTQHYGGNHIQQQMGMNGGLSLPDSSATSNEKALMWSQTQYMSDSGYSTQAPSICSIDAFLNNEQMDSTLQSNNIEQLQPIQPPPQTQTQIPTTQQTEPKDWNQMPPPLPQPQQPVVQEYQPQQQQQQQQQQIEQSIENEEDDNAVVNWMNYQDSSELAVKAIPDVHKFLADQDYVVVQQAAAVLHQMCQKPEVRDFIIQNNALIQTLVDCLNVTNDLETCKSIVGTFYLISAEKKLGAEVIIKSNALPIIVKTLCSQMETIVSYAITILHNILLEGGDKVKQLLRKCNAIQFIVPTLNQTSSVKYLTIAVDCLYYLTEKNQESKQLMLEFGGTATLVNLLASQVNYPKLIFNTTRLLRVLSSCSQNKQHLVNNYNAMPILTTYLSSNSTSKDIVSNVLCTFRNLSDLALRLSGLETLIQNLLNIVSNYKDSGILLMGTGVLSNLTCHNENNKKAAVRANGIQILFNIIHSNMAPFRKDIIDECVCCLRHITNRSPDMLLAQEQLRNLNGVSLITHLMVTQPRSWSVVKASLGLVRNLCQNQLNSANLRANNIIERLMTVMYEAFMEVQRRTENFVNVPQGPIKVDDVNLLEIIDLCSGSLVILAKENSNQLIMRDLDCIGFFVQLFLCSSIHLIQRAGISILAELASGKECAEYIDMLPGLHQFIQAQFCTPYGGLKSIADLVGSNTTNTNNISIVLQQVSTLMQRLQDFKNQRAYLIQQQQQQQQQRGMYGQQYPQQPTMHPQQQLVAPPQPPVPQQQLPTPPQMADQYAMQMQQPQQQYYQQQMSQQQQFNQFY